MRKYSILIVCMFLIAGLFVPLMVTDDAEGANLTFNSEAALDGTLWTYVQFGVGSFLFADTADTKIEVGRWWGSQDYATYRGYLSFNTASIPDTFEVISATLNVRVDAVPPNPSQNFSVEVESVDYGAALTTVDWTVTGPTEGTLLTTGTVSNEEWVSMPVSAERVDKAGHTQYRLISSLDAILPTATMDEVIDLHSADSANDPYLTVQVDTYGGAIVTYNFTQAGMTNHTTTIFPCDVHAYNNTAELIRYEVFLRNATYTRLQVEPNYTYQSHHPELNVTALGSGLYNLTQPCVNFSWYHIWFLRNRTIATEIFTTTVNIGIWHNTIGEGFFFERWKIMINEGDFYNHTPPSRVPVPSIEVDYGVNYTISVLDYFDNHITNYTFTANQENMDVLIPVEVYTFKAKNIRRDTSMLSVYFNAAGDPFTQHLCTDEIWAMPIRAGDYMFRFTYLNTEDNITYTMGDNFYYNLTIDGDYTAYIGDDLISIIYTTTSGMVIDIGQIITYVQQPVQVITAGLSVVPADGTRSEQPATPYILRHPYAVVEATADRTISGTSGTFWDPRPSTGTTKYITDDLTIASNYAIAIMLNHTGNGTRFANLTTNPGIIDLTQYTGVHNFTIWANDTFNAVRQTHFRHSAFFYWQYYPSTDFYTTTLILNNSTPIDWDEVYWVVVFANEPEDAPADLDTVRVYDQLNTVYLTTNNYTLTTSAIHMFFEDGIVTGQERPHAFSYYAQNATWDQGTPIITLRSYMITEWRDHDRYYGTGTWNNQFAAPYEGDIAISLKNLDGTIDPDKVWVYDTVNDETVAEDTFVFSGNSITVNWRAVGEVGVGESRVYTVYFDYKDTEPQELLIFRAPWQIAGIYLNLHLCMFIAAVFVGGYGAVEVRNGKESAGLLYIVIGAIIFLVYAALGMMHAVGAI